MAFTTAPTLCEVTYDISEEEKRYTPFRYQCRSAPTRANTPGGYSEVTNYSLPSGLTVTYYEYLRSLYDSRIQSAKKAYRHCSSAHPSTGSRIGTGINGPGSECGSRRSGRPTTALPYSPTTLPSVAQSPGSRMQDEFEDVHDSRLYDDKLVWVDALNKWIPENQLNSRPYVSFVGTAPTVEKLYSSLREQRLDASDGAWCDRYDEHMKLYEQKAKHGMAPKPLQPENSFINRIMALKKKEALRKKAQEQLEIRRQRKSHSLPLYASVNEKRQKVRFQMPTSTKVSPRSPREAVVKEQQDFQKSWDDEVNTQELKEDVKEKEIITGDEVKESSSSEADLVDSSKELEEIKEVETKLVEKTTSEINKENAAKLIDSLPTKEKRKTEKQVVIPVVPTMEEPQPHRESMMVEDTSPPNQPSGRLTTEIQKPFPQTITSLSQPTKGEPKKVKKEKAPKKDTSTANVKPVPIEKEVKQIRSKTKSLTKVKSKSKENVKEETIELEEYETLISEDTTHSVSTIEDTKTGPLSLTVSTDRSQMPEDIPPPTQAKRRSVVKKTFIAKERPKSSRSESTPSPVTEEEKSVTPEVEEPKRVIEVHIEEPALPRIDLEEPPLPNPSVLKCKESKVVTNQRSILTIKPVVKPQQKELKKQRQFSRDTSYEEELRREEEAERRRQRQMEMLEKMKTRKNKVGTETESNEEARKFDNYGFLAKYCIFSKGALESYKRTFESVDDERRGWIQGVEVMIALRGINQNISYNEEEYLYRVLEIAGYNVSQGADFKLFAVMAALSLKISALDTWMKNMIGSMDFKMLDTKMYMCKKLWECNVDPDTNKIPIDQLCIELRAGGISPEHEAEVREKLGHLKALDLLDFLTYVPLFIMIHESVVDNPFDERREK